MKEIQQPVDPLVVDAIKRAVEQEDFCEWAKRPVSEIPKLMPVEKRERRPRLQTFISIITP